MRVCKQGCDVTLSVFPEKYFIKAIEDFFRVYKASCKHSGDWNNSRKFCKPSTASGVW